uniref:Putative salivary lipocalin n=1 Tax=Ixodes ricinus TaxID=34613 RepID=A0A0K8R8C7_IXORI
MLALLCVVAALIACSDAAKLSEQQRKERQAKSSTNAWLLFTDTHKYYLLYRSVKNDTAYGGFKQCVNMSLRQCWDLSLELWYYFYYQGIYTNEVFPVNHLWITMNSSGEQRDLVKFRYPYYADQVLLQLLFTDYETCFVLQQVDNEALQVWMIGSTNTTRINDTCHSTYNKTLNKTGNLSEIPKYYIYNETICGKKE